jgi:PAS domain S-box-containing protein
MPQTLRVLIVEDSATDAELGLRELRRAGFDPQWHRVETESDFLAHLHPELELILSDYSMPEFSGLRALELLRAHRLDIPFILISGTIGEDLAVNAMKQGVTDYFLKDRLARLGPAIEHALAQARLRRERQQAETALRESEERFRQLAENIQEVFWLTDPTKNHMLYVSPAYEAIWGRTCAELYASPRVWLDAIHSEDRARILEAAETKQSFGDYDEEYRILRPDGAVRWIRDRAFPVRNAAGEVDRIAGVARDITERKQAERDLLEKERQLHASDRRLAEIVHGMTEACFALDKDWHFTFVNDRCEPLLQHSREQMLGRSIWEVFQKLVGTPMEKEYRRAMAERIPVTFEAFSPVAQRWLDIRLFPSGDGLAAFLLDIHARQLAELALRGSEERLRLITNLVPHGIFAKDAEGRHIYANRALAEMAGLPIEDLIGKTDFDLIPNRAEAEAFRADDRAVLESGVARFIPEESFIDEQGHRHFLQTTKIPFTVPETGERALLGVWVDITDWKRAETQVREQAAMLDQAHDAIIVRGYYDRKITFWNKGAETLYGWTAAEAAGQDIADLICVDLGRPDEIRDELLTHNEWRGETRHKTRAGKELIINTRASLVRDAEGEPQSVLSINTDVTEQKNLEARFLRAQRMESIGTLASGVAHDLNNILAPIMMSAPLLRYPLEDEQRDSIISNIEACAARGADVVKQVLTFGRGLEGEKRPLQITSLVTEMLKIMQETFPKNIEVHSTLPSGLWPVIGDATQLHQVLLNLCVNARDAMPDGGQLRLVAANLDLDASYASMIPDATAGQHVLLEVSDTGAGIPPEIIERIFDPFFTTKGIGKGTGLGLSTVLGIVRGHGGFIHVKSRPSLGTTFEVYLPAAPGEETLEIDSAHEPIPRGNGELVLVVDDEVSVRSSVRTALETGGYSAMCAADGSEALAAFAMNSAKIGAVLTDLMMPMVDGLTLIRALRAMKPGLPIIASTGLGEKNQLAELKALNVELVLHKPYRADTLLRTIHDVLRKPSA